MNHITSAIALSMDQFTIHPNKRKPLGKHMGQKINKHMAKQKECMEQLSKELSKNDRGQTYQLKLLFPSASALMRHSSRANFCNLGALEMAKASVKACELLSWLKLRSRSLRSYLGGYLVARSGWKIGWNKDCFKNKPMCYPQQLFKILECFSTGTLRNFVCYVYRNLPEPPPLSAPQPSEPHQLSGPEPSGTSSALCTGTLRNLISHLHRNRPEPHQLSAPEPSGTSSAFCTGTLRNLLRNLGLQLHRIAPKLFWAKDPIASFAVGEKEIQF